MQLKKICFVTAARSEYGLLKWIMKDIQACESFQFQLIVTGGHLSREQGHTIEQILADGFSVSAALDIGLDTSSPLQIASSMGRLSEKISHTFDELKPDYLMVLGDRYELLSICSAAFIMRIPIIHLSGGDVTEGAIDDGVRNAVTMLAEYHFPGTEASAENIMRMRGSAKNIWAVGEPGLDAFYREPLMSRSELSSNLGLDSSKQWLLMTYHPESQESLEHNLFVVKRCIEAIVKLDHVQLVATYANADFGGKQINEYLEQQAAVHAGKIVVIPSLGQLRYLSFMRQASAIIGNSSSAIVEAPFLGIPVVNIGNRQKGRYQCSNILQCEAKEPDIKEAIEKILTTGKTDVADKNYWGSGHTSEQVLEILKRELG